MNISIMETPETLEDWLRTVPAEETADPVWRLQAYRRARFAVIRCWPLAGKLRTSPLGHAVGTQLWRATAAIPPDIAEGYSRSSPADRIRFLEYALGSTREALSWCDSAQLVLPSTNISPLIVELRSIRNLLLKMISSQRARLGRKPVFG